MAILLVGASGATGRLLVEELLNAGQQVKLLIRPGSKVPESWLHNQSITLIRSDFQRINPEVISGCESVASCLGHNPTLKGIYGQPRKLVRDTVRLLCEAIQKTNPQKPVRFVLMGSAGVRNNLLKEPVSFAQQVAIGLIRLLVPPHADNEQAAAYLSRQAGSSVEWVVVRPDTLTNETKVSRYSLHVSPVRSALFRPGKTSRINVANFMSRLLTEDVLWEKWKGQMPVIYNEEF